jgi:predicted RNase H-like nuclease
MAAASFIGIDLAWAPRNPSGLAALEPSGRRLRVAAVETRLSDDEIVDFVGVHRARLTVVMVDAPLVIPKGIRMRECDKLTHRLFGRRQAGCYPANRENMGRYNGGVPRGHAILRRLGALGFEARLLPSRAIRRGRLLFECYPHPAQVVLFGLPKTLKYKLKRQGYPVARREFRRYLRLVQSLRDPALDLGPALLRSLDVTRAVGRAYKDCEDRLDALFCAYLAALVPRGRLEMLGTPRAGNIVVPREAGHGTRRR